MLVGDAFPDVTAGNVERFDVKTWLRFLEEDTKVGWVREGRHGLSGYVREDTWIERIFKN